MLPSGAYVTLEHEYILIFRKGQKRVFKTVEEKQLRQRSAFFWEERNKWFSDIWFDLPGASQKTNHKDLRKRSAAFPFELAYRLISMYSVQSDTVLDPFLGMGTTVFASLCAGRNSIGIEIDKSFQKHIKNQLVNSVQSFNSKISERLLNHINFIKKYTLGKGPLKYKNKIYGFPVMTKQETAIQIPYLKSISHHDNNCISAKYSMTLKNDDIERITNELY